MTTSMYEIKNLGKSYRHQEVLKDLSMKFEAGMFVALLGRNGSGKSTLMKMLAQQEFSTAGEILYKGTSIQDLNLKLNDKMVYITEDEVLPSGDSLAVWMEFFKSIYPVDYQFEVGKQLLKQFDVNEEKAFLELSRGQKMKAMFALHAPKKPDVYILDEITSVLDAGSRIALMQFLKKERERGCLIISSSNIATEMQGFATHVCFLDKKNIVIFCEISTLGKYFTKIRCKGENDIELQKKLLSHGAKKVHFNSDNTWSYLILKTENSTISEFDSLADRRDITIEDVSSYFSTGEV